jgi:hypothetical protein
MQNCAKNSRKCAFFASSVLLAQVISFKTGVLASATSPPLNYTCRIVASWLLF